MGSLDIIILLIVVVLVFGKLKNLLGTRPDVSVRQNKITEENAAKIFDLIAKEAEKQKKALENAEIKAEPLSEELSETDKVLSKIPQEIINQRKAEGITSETDLIGFNEAEITSAKISSNDIAKITVKFVSEQVNILKNKDDEVIEGDENFIQNITDVWTFERSLTSTSPNWLLVSTKK